MATKKRRLGDLYITGREFTVNDESGLEPVTVWLQKLNAIEAEHCLRRAGAARSRVFMKCRDKESLEFQDIYSDMIGFERDTLVGLVIREQVAEAVSSAEAELAAEDEWSKDGYLQGLRDAWVGEDGAEGLSRAYEDGEISEQYDEAKRTLDELTRFSTSAQKRADVRIEAIKRDYATTSLDELRERAVEQNIGTRADSAWFTEYRRSQLFYGAREVDNHAKRYFEKREEVDQLAAPLLEQLYNEFEDLMVSVVEGKDLPPTQDSSPPQEQQGAGETAASSGPVVADQ